MAEGRRIGSGFVDILPNVSGFGASLVRQIGAPLEKAGQDAGAKLKASLEKNFVNIRTAGEAAFAAIGIKAAAGIGSAVTGTIEWAGEVRKLARELGLSAEDASRLAVAGDEVGVSVDTLSRGFGLFSKALVNNSANLAKYNLDVVRTNSGQVDMLATLGNVIDAYQKLPAGADRAAFAQNVFGRSGKDLIPILNQGRAGLDELLRSADKYGLTLSGADVQAAFAAEKAQKQLNEAWKGAKVQLGQAFLPLVKVGTEALTQFVVVLDKIPGPIKAVAAGGVAAAGILTGLGLAVRVVRLGLGELRGAFVTKDAVESVSIGLDEAQAGASTAAAGAMTREAGAAGGLGLALKGAAAWLGPLAVGAGTVALVLHGVKKRTDEVSVALDKAGKSGQIDAAYQEQLNRALQRYPAAGMIPSVRALVAAEKDQAAATKEDTDALYQYQGSVSGADHKIRLFHQSLAGLPKRTRVYLDTFGFNSAIAQASTFLSFLRGIEANSRVSVSVAARLYRTEQGIPPRQHGGRVLPGQPYLVGERGPEPFIPDRPGRILPSASGGGGRGWSDETLERVADRITTAIRRQAIQVGVTMMLDSYELQHGLARAEARRTGGRR